MKFLYSFFLIFLFFNNTSYLNADNLKIVFIDMDTIFNESLVLNSIKDNKKFDINAIELLYSLPLNSFALINDEKNNIYLTKIKAIDSENIVISEKNIKPYIAEQKTKNKNSLLKSYDLLLNKKYNVVLNQKTIERVKNFFK